MKVTYKDSGVDIEAGDNLVDWIKETQPKRWPHQERLVEGVGGFAALFDGRFPEMEHPCLVSATDGVGTKLQLAIHFKDYSTIGQDLVAMCVNDLICTGAAPLFFLDYYATGRLEQETARSFISGVREACMKSLCVLIGGETAEMPGLYKGEDFDCAGFSVGVVDKKKAWGSHLVQTGDVLVGVRSSGFHSNGFSLLRKLFASDLDSWRKSLLEPTQLYVEGAMALKNEKLPVRAGAHITGGGLDNLLRVVPKGTLLKLKPWEITKEYAEVKKRSGLSEQEMLRTFNCGLGFVFIVESSSQSAVMSCLEKLGYSAFDLGVVEEGEPEVTQWEVEGEFRF